MISLIHTTDEAPTAWLHIHRIRMNAQYRNEWRVNECRPREKALTPNRSPRSPSRPPRSLFRYCSVLATVHSHAHTDTHRISIPLNFPPIVASILPKNPNVNPCSVGNRLVPKTDPYVFLSYLPIVNHSHYKINGNNSDIYPVGNFPLTPNLPIRLPHLLIFTFLPSRRQFP